MRITKTTTKTAEAEEYDGTLESILNIAELGEQFNYLVCIDGADARMKRIRIAKPGHNGTSISVGTWVWHDGCCVRIGKLEAMTELGWESTE